MRQPDGGKGMANEQILVRPVEAGTQAAQTSRPPVHAPGFPGQTARQNLIREALRTAIENRRLLILQPFALIAGIMAYRLLPNEPQTWALGLLLTAALAGVVALRKTFVGFNLALLAAGVSFGTLLLPLHGALNGTAMLQGSRYGTFSATVDTIHSDDGEDARIIVSHIEPLDGREPVNLRRARLFMPSEQRPSVGDRFSARIRFYAVPGPVMPDSYDSQFQSYFDGIGAFGSVLGDVTPLNTTQNWQFSRQISFIRQAIGARIDAALDGQADAITRALVIGDQGQITDETRDFMASAGLAHVLAISGLHLTLVAGGVFAAIRMGLSLSYAASLRWDLKRIAALGGIATALFYLSISGASVSAVRATIMLVLVFGAVLAGRRALTMRNVALAALVVIVSDPASIFRPSFQLSFAAVTALVGVYENIRPRFAQNRGWFGQGVRFFGGLALTSIIAGLATGLFAAFHFQQMAPLGVLGNVIAVPLLAFVVLPSAFLGVFVMPVGLDPLFFSVTGWGIERIVTIAHFVSALSGDWTSAPPITLVALLFGTLSLAWLAFFEGKIRFAGTVLLIPAVALFGMAQRPDMLVADTTQAVAIRIGKNLALIDGRTGTFAVNAWQEALQEPITKPETDPPCDSEACFMRTENGLAVSYVEGRGAFREDCREADLVITRLVAPDACRHFAQVIDRFDLLRGGVHWARWNGEQYDIRPAISDQTRPWRIQYGSGN